MTLHSPVYRHCVECGHLYEASFRPNSRLLYGFPYCPACTIDPAVRPLIAGLGLVEAL